MSHLFQPLQLDGLTLTNRIIIAPMCQYSADDGSATDWHTLHLGSMAVSGAGLLILEATAVSRVARISAFDLGLYSDRNESALAGVLRTIRTYSPMPVAVQLAHAGRKASTRPPWDGGGQIAPSDPLGWQTVGPSAAPHNPSDAAPIALDRLAMTAIRDDFVAAAHRAARIGLDGIEVHGAHGYLLHQFLSPLANSRSDEYGGSLENRMRFPLEIFDAVRAAFPSGRPVWMRVSGTDWVPGGWDIDSTIAFAHELARRGCAALHVSSGGVSPAQTISLAPGYQIGLAARVKAETTLPSIAVGLITDPQQAEAVLENGHADAVSIARAMLYDARWPWHAAAALGAQVDAPRQYWRSQPREHKSLFRGA